MDSVVSLLLGMVVQTTSLLLEARQLIGLVAAALAAILAAQLGWHGTDRLISWRGRPDED
ncbi:hypothetical protein Acsp04_24210 [Actinomadura sp. NBRC 104425]|uniref:hypothetical protein n=1 Tax=Actinomadura sp. NBRC 104425 TaxID=3032204 RepID=UPI0024A32130|nr:hypothetical protein [Actinomadura sp. NBRC 104425]GLZ12186.1 hypothetical protein Acsp04_24210 [Actinomadura sp. NBRC 104425]